MTAISIRTIDDEIRAAAEGALLASDEPGATFPYLPEDADEAAVVGRKQAAQRLARQMDAEARKYARMTERLEVVLRSEKVRHRAAWATATRDRDMRLHAGV